ncbi:MAG: hypothetical protein LBK44_02065 [Spirochaetales bacterium]|nr:hypothetical protein [Spirochaetales bacterium]
MQILWAFRYYPGCMGEQRICRMQIRDQPLARAQRSAILRSKIRGRFHNTLHLLEARDEKVCLREFSYFPGKCESSNFLWYKEL